VLHTNKNEIENLLHYYLPKIAPYLSFLRPRHAPLTNEYVIQVTTRQHDPAEYTLVERLTNKEFSLQPMQVAAECKDHMAAGIDTTGDGLCFLMWELSQPQHLPFQRRLQQELLANSAPDDDSRVLDSLPYMDAVVKEALRISPPIPMSLPRYVPPGGRTIDDYFVPEGTIVSCQPYSVHRLNTDVFPEPDRFNPDRWLESDGVNERNRLFFAFATGGRGCTGKKYVSQHHILPIYLFFFSLHMSMPYIYLF
jgi:cytochrome P450